MSLNISPHSRYDHTWQSYFFSLPSCSYNEGSCRRIYGKHLSFYLKIKISERFQPATPNTPEGLPVYLAFLPFHHTYGLHTFCFRAFLAPSTSVILSKWNVEHALKAISTYVVTPRNPSHNNSCCRHRVTGLILIPSIALQLVNHPTINKADLSSLSTIASGAAYLPPKLAEKLSKISPNETFMAEGKIAPRQVYKSILTCPSYRLWALRMCMCHLFWLFS